MTLHAVHDQVVSLAERVAAGDLDILGDLRRLDARAAEDADLHAELARIAEAAGDLGRAVLEYNLALKLDVRRPDILWRLAELRLDQGETERAIRCLRRLLEVAPEHDRARLALGRLLLERGAHEPARTILEAGPQTDGWRRKVRGLVDGSDALRRDAQLDLLRDAPQGRSLAQAVASRVPTDAECMTFAFAFAGREGVYARQWSSPTGKSGYSPVEAPFTAAVARHHLMGDFTVGIYPLRSDNTVGWICLDVDIRAAELRRVQNRGRARELQRAAHGTACRLLDTCARHGLTALLEDSGNKGRHVWLLFEPIPAAAALRIGRHLVAETDQIAPETSVEVFPKQSRPGKRGLSSLVKLPLGVHQVSGRRCPFLTPDGTPLEDGAGVLARYQRPSLEVLRAVHAESSRARRPDAPVPKLEPPDDDTDEGVTLVPEGPAYRLEDDEEVDALAHGCAVLNDIMQRAETARVLSNEERTVVTYTMGHLARGADAANAVLSRALNVDRSQLLKSPLRGNPMSCPKIRAKVPLVTARVGCHCEFDVAASYPTPLLHVQAVRSQSRVNKPADELRASDVERLAFDWIKARKDRERLGRVIERIERQLRAIIEARGAPLEVIGGRVLATADGLAFEPTAKAT